MVPEDDESHTNMITFFNQNNSRPNTSQPIQLAPEQLNQLITALQQSSTRSTHSIGQIQATKPSESFSQKSTFTLRYYIF